MELEVFAGQEKSELLMIGVARAILKKRGRGREIYFSNLVNEIQNYLEKSDAEIREALPHLHSTLNADGSFISLGDNKWGLRSWYAINEIDKEIITLEEDEDGAPKCKPKRVNALMDGGEGAIDYSDDDPENEGSTPESSDLEYDEENSDDKKPEVGSYDLEINRIISDEDLNEEVDINEGDGEGDDLDEE